MVKKNFESKHGLRLKTNALAPAATQTSLVATTANAAYSSIQSNRLQSKFGSTYNAGKIVLKH